MQKKIFILWLLFFIPSFSYLKESTHLPDARIIIAPITPLLHKQITAESIRRGHIINSPGLYSLTTSSIKIESDDAPANSHTVGGATETRGLIAITSSNVILDFGGAVITTDKASEVAITVGDGLKNITIRNGIIASGSQNFDSGIIIGQGCKNINIANISIQGAVHADGAINIKGASGQTVNDLVLENLMLSNNATFGLKCSYCDDVHVENIFCNSNSSSGTISSINFNNCLSVFGREIHANNNSGNNSTIGLEINTCNDVNLENIFTTNNTDAVNTKTEGVKINASKNITLSNVHVNNLTKALYGISVLAASKNITLENIKINNCNSTGGTLTALYVSNSQSVSINQATISNNIGTVHCNAISCATATNHNISISNSEIASNTASAGIFRGIEIGNSEMIVIDNCKITRNTATTDLYGIVASTSSSDVYCSKSEIVNNSSSSTATIHIIAGIHCTSVNGLRIEDSIFNRNAGTAQAYGIYLKTLDHAFINNCTARGNAASTAPTTHKPSAGLFLQQCSHCDVLNSSFINNRAGDHTTVSSVDAVAAGIDFSTNTTIGAGIINIGGSSSLLNIGNRFINCVCNSNRTQLGTTDPGAGYVVYNGATGRRYSTLYALAAGAANQWAKNTEYRNCTFNDNGFSNFEVGYGLLNVNDAEKTHCISCTASNNNHYGFYDDGALETIPLNCELFFVGCLAISNGAANPVATAFNSAGHQRNCRVYFTSTSSSNPPFIILNYNNFSLTTLEQNPLLNISVIETSA
jgi:hypothetical protein